MTIASRLGMIFISDLLVRVGTYHFLISSSQLVMTASGTAMSTGPLSSRRSKSVARKAMDCAVLPSP